MAEIVITGVAGFIGSSIARSLIEAGENQIVGIDCFTNYYDTAIKLANVRALTKMGGDFKFLDADLTKHDLSTVISGDTETVFHQAGQPGVRKSWGTEFNSYLTNNILATQRLLECCRNLPNLTRFIYASSSSVYGNAEKYPTRETDLPVPRSPYGVTKLAAEHLCSLYALNFQVPTVSLRYFTVYGPGQRPDMAFTRFCHAARNDQTITLYGDGTQIRDFTFIDDVVRANILCMKTREITPGEVMNISGGSNISVNEALEVIQAISSRRLKVNRIATAPGDVVRTGGLSEVARERLGWKPMTRIEDGLRLQLEWVSKTTLRQEDLVN
ncbi:UDP-glucose 4-epimerase [Gordonia polyisoprenivorans]|nr:UDP-glucose 4-epimerase [Gordonia polyisoprenivorans]